jgi:microsomal dipeptidase-like Zn-dependent dipeptidase
MKWEGGQELSNSKDFYRSDINFYDEEIELIGASNGLFAVQFDARRIARFELVKKTRADLFEEKRTERAVHAIWLQLEHIAMVLDNKGQRAWGCTCIGSDYDGTIDPLPGIWTASQFPLLYSGILGKAEEFLNGPHGLKLEENKMISPKEIADRFFFQNTLEFLQRYYRL